MIGLGNHCSDVQFYFSVMSNDNECNYDVTN